MPRVGHDPEVRFGPTPCELEGGVDRADDVVTTMHDDGGCPPNPLDAVEQLVLVLEEAPIDEIVRLDARESERELRRSEQVFALGIGEQRARRTFPHRPRARRVEAHGRIVGQQAPVEGREQIVALLGRNRRDVLLPLIGKKQVRAELVEPSQLDLPQQEDAAQHELADGARMRLGIGQCQRAAPRAAEDEPTIELEVPPQALHVGDEVPSRVRFERGVRAAPSRAALIEHDDPIALRGEETPRVDVAATARTAVNEQGRLAFGVARLLVVDLVAVADGEIPRVERLDRRILRPGAHDFLLYVPLRCASSLRLYSLNSERGARTIYNGGRASAAGISTSSKRMLALEFTRRSRRRRSAIRSGI